MPVDEASVELHPPGVGAAAFASVEDAPVRRHAEELVESAGIHGAKVMVPVLDLSPGWVVYRRGSASLIYPDLVDTSALGSEGPASFIPAHDLSAARSAAADLGAPWDELDVYDPVAAASLMGPILVLAGDRSTPGEEFDRAAESFRADPSPASRHRLRAAADRLQGL